MISGSTKVISPSSMSFVTGDKIKNEKEDQIVRKLR